MSKCLLGVEQDCTECRMCNTEKKQMSNGDRIRSMANSELANLLSKADNLHHITCSDAKNGCAYGCKHGFVCEKGDTKKEKMLIWLQAERKE